MASTGSAQRRDVAWQFEQNARQCVAGVVTQLERLREVDGKNRIENERRIADAQFLIVALWRLRMAAEAAEELVSEPRVVRAAIVEFDRAFPRLESLRHVLMHFDNYVSESDDRRNTDASGSRLLARHDVWAMHVSPDGISWLGASYNYDPTEQAALALYRVVSERLLEVAGE